MTIDTACSAALVASHEAAAAVCRHECGEALAFGVNMVLTPVTSSRFAMAGMTSPRGRSHTFDKSADGYGRSESCCGIVLGTDGHRLVTVRGSGIRQDGRSASLTAPSGQAQAGLIVAALSDAGTSATAMALVEAHGTGTALGDPIEAGSLVAAVLAERGTEASPIAVGGVKANIGHAEPAAGMTGLLKLSIGLQKAIAAPNAQLRVLNPMANETFQGMSSALAVQVGHLAPGLESIGGVSSFGYSGTIAHAVLHSKPHVSAAAPIPPMAPSTRRSFAWCELVHPFIQLKLSVGSETTSIFRSSTNGALCDLVCDHIVQGRVIFPAVGYLEMARGAASSGGLLGVFFLQPLPIEPAGLLVECALNEGRFDIRSGADENALLDGPLHCAGAYSTIKGWQGVEIASLRAGSSIRGACIGDVYDEFAAAGLQYGPGFRTLVQAWGGRSAGLARLQPRSVLAGTDVHPADLDDALCASALITSNSRSSQGETRLPFAVDAGQLQGAPGDLWAVCAPLNLTATFPHRPWFIANRVLLRAIHSRSLWRCRMPRPALCSSVCMEGVLSRISVDLRCVLYVLTQGRSAIFM